MQSFFFNDTATTEIYTSFPTRRSSDLHGRRVVLDRQDSLSDRTHTAHHGPGRSEEHTPELQSPDHLVCRLLLQKKNAAPAPVDAAPTPRGFPVNIGQQIHEHTAITPPG